MNTNSTNNSSLVLHAQEGSCLEDGRCHPGILSFNPGKGYVFEETLPRPAYVPNPRIFDGEHLSVARRRDGRIQPHLKTITVDESFDPSVYCALVYEELLTAMRHAKR